MERGRFIGNGSRELKLRRMAFQKEDIVEGLNSWRKMLEDDVTETSGAKSVKTENDIVGCGHDEEITSENTGLIDERKREGQGDEI